MKNKRGFTLIELLIVIAIIAILASIVFVALNPLTRFRDARDSRRWADVHSVLNAIRINQVDHKGAFLTPVASMETGTVYMITNAAVSSGCANYNNNCKVDVTGDNYCVNLGQLLIDGYLGNVPVSPSAGGTWSDYATGYTLEKDSNDILIVRACESEDTPEIKLAR
ncbi:MAG: prepilin-type N-terminal cleavage/methylation domain-containing protein [Candidatus Falkowbacteria bacterium]